MVSGLVTSPWLQLRIFSGEAREIRMESKSAIIFSRSYGDERYMMVSPNGPSLIRRQRGLQVLARSLHQLHIQTQGLQLADQHVKAFRNARLSGGFALYDGFVNLGAAVDVIGLRGQKLLQY